MVEFGIPSAADLKSRDAQQILLHESAATLTRKHFGKRVFVRAVVEISNYCRENCAYCGMRRDNRGLHRFRAKAEQLAELLMHGPASVTDVNIQAGEDPIAVREVALPLIRMLRERTNLGITVCLGLHDPNLYRELQEAGAAVYIMKFEVPTPERYSEVQAPGTFEKRIYNIRHLADNGWFVSSGFIAGLPGQSEAELVQNFTLAAGLPLVGISVTPFIPGEATPLGKAPLSDVNLTLNCMAALRIMRPDWVIPAVSALNLAEPGAGYRRGLRAGANLVTMNLTPRQFADDYIIYKRDRFIMTEERILTAIAEEGLSPSAESLVNFYRSRGLN